MVYNLLGNKTVASSIRTWSLLRFGKSSSWDFMAKKVDVLQQKKYL